MSDLIAKMLQACDGPAPNLYADLLVIRDETERLEARLQQSLQAEQGAVKRIAELEALLSDAYGHCVCPDHFDQIQQTLKENHRD